MECGQRNAKEYRRSIITAKSAVQFEVETVNYLVFFFFCRRCPDLETLNSGTFLRYGFVKKYSEITYFLTDTASKLQPSTNAPQHYGISALRDQICGRPRLPENEQSALAVD